MKKQFFSLLVFSALLGLFFTSSCKKENGDSKNDLTASVVGKYTNPNDYNLEIVVNKIDNSTVTITLQNGYFDYAFTNVKMNTATSFTLNEYTQNGWCENSQAAEEATVKASGTGTASNNNISLFVTEQIAGISGVCNENYSYTFSASK